MTNGELLQRQNALTRAVQHVQSVRARYAIQKTLRNVEGALETYSEMLQEIAVEHGVDLSGGGVPNDAPDEFREELEELLQMEAEEPEVHSMPLSVLDTEDDKGSDIPLDVVASLDFMIDE